MKEQKFNFSMFRKFSKYYKPYKGIIALDLFCAALTTACELIFPLIVRYITNEALVDIGHFLISSVLKIGAVYLFVRLVDTAANYYMAYIAHVMGTRLETDMRRDIFSHLQKLSFSFYDEAKVGQLMSRVTSDLFDITEFSHHCPEEIFIAFIKIIGAVWILGGIHPILTLVIVILMPLMVLCSIVFRKKMNKAFKENRKEAGELNAQLEDSLLGIRVVQGFANEEIEQEKFRKGNVRFFESKRIAYKFMAQFQASTRFFEGVMYVAVLVIGSLFMISGQINPADLIAYLLYIQTLLTSVRRIVEFTEQFQKGVTGIERFMEVMEEEPQIKDRIGAKELLDVHGDISFCNVSFTYGEDLESVLSDFNLEVKKGENIALVGPSGGGKTTLCSLIPRFYEVSEGAVLLDGTDVRDYTLASLRQKIGIVQQEVYLFSGTVLENIAYGKPGASREEIEKAAILAGAHDFISALPNGYDTYVGERGVKLSGGQKQRISIARVFLKNPPILILDEATSALDNESEKLIQNSLEKLAENRTTFTIAHRLTTVRNADKILVLTEEGIVESGSHAELMEKNGVYADMYRMYSA